MNYYVEGNSANADKIKAAFEKLGYYVKNWRFFAGVYYTLNGKIVNTHFGSNEYKLVLNNPDYKELELLVEPKFKVGDWIAYNENKSSITPMQIIRITENRYIVSGDWSYDFRTLEADWHLWTIADTKDGDVLCTYECGEPKIVFIHKLIRKNGSNIFMYYCFYNIMYPRFDANNEPGCLAPKREDVKPATKEQRDLLFAKMKEAGYEWDTDKKELRKIQPHYDIANFHAGMPVLVRDFYKHNEWTYAIFSHYNKNHHEVCRFMASGAGYWQCIPFNEETKHLLGTTDMPSEEYINW